MERLKELYDNFCDVNKITEKTIDTVKELIDQPDVRKKLIQDENFMASFQMYEDFRTKILAQKKQYEDLSKKNEALQKEEKTLEKTIKDLKTEIDSRIEKIKTEIGDKDSLYQQMIDVLKDDAMAKVIATLDGRDNNTTVPLKEELSPKTIEDKEEFSDPKIKEDDIFQGDLDTLVKTIGEYRKYKENDIINMLLCISQNFLTVFSGAPGTGKTSFSRILGHSLGLDRPEWGKTPRFITVAVEQGWSSKKDLIGYYNPLSGSFTASNPKVYQAFLSLDKESREEKMDYPMIILLDEANLSSMEYYWADFMGICDTFQKGNSEIAITNEKMWQIPKTLRFLATINNDTTTETLSPRLLDRAWVITLPIGEDSGEKEFDKDEKIITFEVLTNFFSEKAKSIDDEIKLLDTICKGTTILMNKKETDCCGLNELIPPISHRTMKQIKNYCEIGKNYFSGKSDADKGKIALDFAISQKLLTRINGNGEEYGKKLKDFAELLKAKGLEKSAEIVKTILKHGENKMHYYEFF